MREELMGAFIANINSKSIITTGFPEVDDLLATLEKKLQRKAISKGTRAGAKVVAARARRFVPHDTGLLERTLTVRTAKRVVDSVTGKARKLKRGKEFGHEVTHRDTGSDDPFYSHFVEFGTVKWEGDPYIIPALFDSSSKVLAASRKAIIDGVAEIAKKARKGKSA